jgi:AcrR family transcriptional regulator
MTQKRRTKEQWLSLALEELSKEGGGRLRIETLVRALGVTKGSFYWHFEDRADFVRQLLDYWDSRYTRSVEGALEPVLGGGAEKLLALMELIVRDDLARYDVAIRAWAAQDSDVAKRVKKVDQFRYSFVRSLFSDLGFTGAELEMRTRTFVTFASMERALLVPQSKSDRRKHLLLRHQWFTR